MNIGIDYDGTYSADPEMWTEIIAIMKKYKHEVKITTYRDNSPKNALVNNVVNAAGAENNIEVVYTAGYQKAGFCKRKGWVPDVWIDDDPRTIPIGNELETAYEACASVGDLD